MANTGSYSMCMGGTDEAIEELRALLNSDAFPSIYGCDNFGFDEPNRFSGEFNGSFLNSVDIYDEESLFRSTVAQLGLRFTDRKSALPMRSTSLSKGTALPSMSRTAMRSMSRLRT